MKPLMPSLTLCQRLTPGLGLRMGMERTSSTPVPPVEISTQLLLIAGQSLAVGSMGLPLLSLAQNYLNKMFVGGVRSNEAELGSLVPLIATEDGTDGETIANGSVDGISAEDSAAQFVVADHALNGARYSQIKKGTDPYNLGMAQATSARDLVPANYAGVIAVATCHGEQDQAFNTVGYDEDLAEWQIDYETDLKVIFTQAGTIPLLVYQQCLYPPSGADSAATATALESLVAHEDNPGKVILVGPNYSWIRQDGIHLTGNGYRSMGLMYQRVLKVLMAGGTWEPIRPLNVSRAGAVIDITFAVPNPPLVFDLELVFNPGNYGFSYKDDTDSATISSVAIVGDDTVRVTLSGTPTGANKLIRYGWSGTTWSGGNGPAGPLGSARGCLRDQGDASPNLYGYDAFNWGVLFNKPAT